MNSSHQHQKNLRGGGGVVVGFQFISRDKGGDQLREVPITGKPLRDQTRGLG